MEADSVLNNFPKTRPPLPTPQLEIYEREYLLNREGSTSVTRLSRRLESWMHRQVAAVGEGETLELGAGTLNQLPYEAASGIYDIVEPMKYLYEGSAHIGRVSRIYADVSEIDVTARYDRIISIAVLEHVLDLPRVIAHSGLLLKGGGVFCSAIPSEGGFLWGLSWRLSTGLSYRLRTGLPYGVVMRHEHVNTAPEIESLIRHFYKEVSVRRFPIDAFHLSFYTLILAKVPRLELCRGHLKAKR